MTLTSDSPASITGSRALSLALGQGGGSGGSAFIEITYTLDQVQAIFAAMNTEAAPADAVWASALAPDQDNAGLTQDGSKSNPYSLRRAIYSATPGKHVLLKDDGVYTQSKVIQTKSQYDEDNYILHTQESPNIIPWAMQEPTSATEKIVIRGEPGTCPALDFTNFYFDVAIDFLEISYLRANNAGQCVIADGFGNFSGPCQGTHVHHVVGEFTQQTGGASNQAFFTIRKGGATGGAKPVFEYNFVKGDNSSPNHNNSCFYIDKTNKWTIRNNYFYGVQSHVVFFKAANEYVLEGGLQTVDIAFENNYCDGNVDWAGSGGMIKNNVITENLTLIASSGGQSTDQDHNTLQNNTVLGNITLNRRDWECDNNALSNNIMSALKIQTGKNGVSPLEPSTNTNTSNHNLINASDDGQRFLWESQYADPAQYKTLAEWQSYMGLDANSAVAADQLVGAGTYRVLADFALINGSVGKTLASDGGAVGADITTVGVKS